MGQDMSSVDNPSGFQLYGPCLRQRMYAVQTAPTINVFHGDIVVHGGTALTTAYGSMSIIEDGSVPDDKGAPTYIGAVTAIFDEDMMPVNYILAAEAGDAAVAGYVMVADHPDQLFIAQEDGVTNAITLSEFGYNAEIQSVAVCLGDTNTGISTQEIASVTAAATATLGLKLHYPHPDDTIADDTNCHARWICSINEHFFGTATAGL